MHTSRPSCKLGALHSRLDVLPGRTKIPRVEVPEESPTEDSDKASEHSAGSDDEPLIISVVRSRTKETAAAYEKGKSLATTSQAHDDEDGIHR